ncbi:MAG: hypothetical protein HY221_01525 [Candidatus Sungbacteria bacterium]|uniref:Aspartate kinase n=1 Tax=Candidatus Sungiibacteriota bacterium TaxID=2750080 RepID=A0A932QY57_9BACT|nr:hypothetical protein [Candidatus Sungbacteria bacterium]
MMKISDTVEEILYSSEIALSALNGGFLNLSAYAKAIRKDVEARTKKPVRTGSIVVALSRMKKTVTKREPLLPEPEIEDLSVKSGLVEATYDRTRDNLARLRALYGDRRIRTDDFFMVTQGTGEITIVALEQALPRIRAAMQPAKAKASITGLVGVTARFDEKYIAIPNIIFAFVRRLALKRINIVEIVSTYTELTFIVAQHDLPEAFLALNEFFHTEKSDPNK